MHCLNPDRLVIRGGVPEACAGAIADVYEMLGGRVTWYGKPHPRSTSMRCTSAGNPPKDEVLAVGDALQTDVAGRGADGLRLRLRDRRHSRRRAVSRRISPREYGLGDWRPVAVVELSRLEARHEPSRTRSRARSALLPDRRPVRGRKRGAAAAHGGDAQEHRRQARHPLHLQVELRQGQPLVGQELPRARAWTRACVSSPRSATSSACRS